MKCRKCHSENLVMRPNAKNPSATELICGDCGTWQKFIGKEEIRIFEIKAALKSRPTNADRIRSMSDKELAEYIFDLGNGSEYCYGHCAYQDDCATKGLSHDTCIKGVIDWLKQKEEV